MGLSALLASPLVSPLAKTAATSRGRCAPNQHVQGAHRGKIFGEQPRACRTGHAPFRYAINVRGGSEVTLTLGRETGRAGRPLLQPYLIEEMQAFSGYIDTGPFRIAQKAVDLFVTIRAILIRKCGV